MFSPIALRFAVLSLWLLPAAFPAEQDAIAIHSIIQARHLPYGTILDPVIASDTGNIVSYTRCGDSALWTGHYIAAEGFRYKVTGAADAQTNMFNAVQGLRLLIDVTGNDTLARCAVPADSPYADAIASEEKDNGIYQSYYNGVPYIWVGNTSRDAYSGAIFGLLVAFDMTKDQLTRDWCSNLITRMLDHVLNNAWNVVLPDGTLSTSFLVRPDQQLTMLLAGKHVNGGAFNNKYSALSNTLSPTVPVPVGIDCADEKSSYFKFNLDYINFYTLKRFGSGYSSFWYGLAYDELRSTTDGHANAFFNMIDRAVGSPDVKRDAETRSLLDAWLLRPRTDVYRDFHGTVQACGDNDACQPLPVEDRVTTDFVWQRDPFQLSGGGLGNIETAGIDYILPYWMARFYNIVTQ
jgi:hypothetical protein